MTMLHIVDSVESLLRRPVNDAFGGLHPLSGRPPFFSLALPVVIVYDVL